MCVCTTSIANDNDEDRPIVLLSSIQLLFVLYNIIICCYFIVYSIYLFYRGQTHMNNGNKTKKIKIK